MILGAIGTERSPPGREADDWLVAPSARRVLDTRSTRRPVHAGPSARPPSTASGSTTSRPSTVRTPRTGERPTAPPSRRERP